MKPLFIHIPKNAGMSIREQPGILTATPENLISREYAADMQQTMRQAGEHPGTEHARLRDWHKGLRKKHKAFAIVRNPWSRTVSRWTFWLKAVREGKVTMPDGYTFRDFLRERHKYGNLPYYWHRAVKGWFLQKDYVVDELGQRGCHVVRFERLNDDLQRIGIGPVRKCNVSERGDYRNYYTDETAEIVGKWHAEDLKYFGFSFDGPATRNIH